MAIPSRGRRQPGWPVQPVLHLWDQGLTNGSRVVHANLQKAVRPEPTASQQSFPRSQRAVVISLDQHPSSLPHAAGQARTGGRGKGPSATGQPLAASPRPGSIPACAGMGRIPEPPVPVGGFLRPQRAFFPARSVWCGQLTPRQVGVAESTRCVGRFRSAPRWRRAWRWANARQPHLKQPRDERTCGYESCVCPPGAVRPARRYLARTREINRNSTAASGTSQHGSDVQRRPRDKHSSVRHRHPAAGAECLNHAVRSRPANPLGLFPTTAARAIRQSVIYGSFQVRWAPRAVPDSSPGRVGREWDGGTRRAEG